MMYSKEVIDEVKRRVDIIDLIGQYVNLKPAGKNYKGLCPFHNEKTPSFSVSPDGVFYCFGCKESGNSISFVQKYLNLDFSETIRFLAEKYGVPLTEDNHNHNDTIEDTLRNIYAATKEYYFAALFRPIGQDALDYFIERKLTDATITQFGLGYSPNAFDHLYKELRRSFTDEQLLESGVIRSANGKQYDFFRNRAMFPIKDFLGRTIAFGGRQLVKDENSGKYVNSAESKIYDKKQTLFGLHEAKSEIRKTKSAIIVEGYLDMLSMFQAGYKNVVAACGTALSKEQLLALKKHGNCSTIYFVFDGDTAGINAALRGIQPALELGLDLRIITLPKGKDPDGIINDVGKEQMDELIEHYLSFPEFITNRLTADRKFNSPAEKAAAMREIVQYITYVPDKLQHKFYIENVQQIFDTDITTLRSVYRQAIGKTDLHVEPPQYTTEEQYSVVEEMQPLLPPEQTILHFAINSQKYLNLLQEKGISPDSFITDLAKTIYEIITENSIGDIPDLKISNQIKSTIFQLANKPITNDLDSWKKFTEVEQDTNICALIDKPINELRLMQINLEINELQRLIATNDEQILLRYKELIALRQIIAST